MSTQTKKLTWRQRFRPGRWLVVIGAGLLGASIIEWNVSASPTIPGPEERKAAARVEPSPGGEGSAPRPDGNFISANAVIEPADREIQVSAAVEGRIEAIHVEEGQWVEAGTLLVTLEHDVDQAAIAVAEGKEKQAAAELHRLVRGNRAEDVAAADAELERLEAVAALSRDQKQRVAKLASTGVLPGQDLVTTQLQAEADRAAVKRAAAQRDALRQGFRVERIAAARAALNASKAARSQAEAVLQTRFVKAPRSGEVLQVKVRPGEYYRPGHSEPLVVIGDTRQLRARVDVYERDIGGLRQGARVIVRAPAFPGTDFVGEVETIGRRMGRKNVVAGEPGELLDSKILEVVVALESVDRLISGQRVVAYIDVADDAGSGTEGWQQAALGQPAGAE